MKRTLVMLSLVAAAAGTSRRSSADDARADDVVVTGTRTPERSQRATVKTDVVTRDEIERRGATNVGEALATQPGVTVNPGAYGYLGSPAAIQIQGFDLERVLILEDGEPVIGDVGGAVDLSSISTADVDRIEVVTGPTSALYGSSAIGGVVNVLTAPPRDDGAAARARLEGRSYDGVVAQGSGTYKRGGAWAGLDAAFMRMDGIARDPSLPDLQIPENARRTFGLKGGFGLGEHVDFRVRARWIHDRIDGLTSHEVPGLGRRLVDQPDESDRYTLHLIENVKLRGGSGVRITMGRQWYDDASAETQRGSAVGETHLRNQRMQSFEAIATIADGKRTWVAGTREQIESFAQVLERTDSLSTGLTTTRADEVVPQSLGTAAFYGQLQWKLADTLTVLPGLRVEHHSRYGESIAPRLAAAWRPTSKLTLRAGAGRGYRAPSAKELGFVFDHSIYGYRVIGNADLRPETSWGVNADASWQVTKEVSLRGGVFANWIEELIDIDVANGTSSGAVVDYSYKNFGRARTFGAQAGATVKLRDHFRAEVAYDYLYTRDDVNDQPLGGRPPHTVSASIRAVPFAKIELYARWRVASDAFVDTATRSPGYETLDLRVGREVWPRSQAYAGVTNVLDVHQDPGRIGDLRPPLGRVVYLGLRAEFPWEDP